MRPIRLLLPGFLLLANATLSHGQITPTPPAASPAAAAPSVPIATAPPQKLLLKVGLNAGRAVRWGGYYGLSARLPLAVGAEYALSNKFTLYGQLDADFRLPSQSAYYGDRALTIPTGALGVGARYYYNQAGRERRNRPHGPFVGNYLALEAHTEIRRNYGSDLRNNFSPGLNLVWGMQRRLGHNFLFDFNAGVGLGPNRNDTSFGFNFSPSPTTITTQFNLGIYFGR